jgi:hypothetical protein
MSVIILFGALEENVGGGKQINEGWVLSSKMPHQLRIQFLKLLIAKVPNGCDPMQGSREAT